MKLLLLALAIASAAPSEAADVKAAVPALELRPKAALTTSVAHNDAPFVNPSEPDLDLAPHRDPRQEQSRSSCEGERQLCYDPAAGRIVYKPTRHLMPDIPGLQRENIAVKRDRIVFRYTF